MKILTWIWKTIGPRRVGHVIFSLFGETVSVLAGPLLQLAVPFFITFRLWRRAEALPAAVSALWSAESLMYTAKYMADANRLALPLIGDPHDWRRVLERAGALESAEEIGLVLHLLASVAAIGAVCWTIRLEAGSVAQP